MKLFGVTQQEGGENGRGRVCSQLIVYAENLMSRYETAVSHVTFVTTVIDSDKHVI